MLLDDAMDTDSPTRLKSAQLLLPYADQALGKPTERREVVQSASLDELGSLPTDALHELVAQGAHVRAVGRGDN
jgi:hypothetical protein